MVKILDQASFKLFGRKVPAVRVSEVDSETGQIYSLQDLGYIRDDPNRLFRVWDQRAWEKSKEAGPITRIGTNGIPEMCYVVSERGEVCNLYTQPWKGPALETVLGRTSALDMIADIMGLVPSMRDKAMFAIGGILAGWLFVGPLINKILS